MNQDLTYGITGQLLYLDAPASEGRPTSVTDVQIFDMTTGDDGTEQTAPGTNTVETNPNTTFDANSGVSSTNRRTLNLAATTGITIGRSYLATNANGETEWVKVVAVTSATSCQAAAPLRNDYVSGDSFQSLRMTSIINATWIANSQNISDDNDPNPGYRVRWTYVDGNGVTRVRYTYFDVTRAAAVHGVTPADMRDFFPGWSNRLPQYHVEDDGIRLLDSSFQQVKWDLHEAGVADEMLRNAEGLDEMVKHHAVWSLYFTSEDFESAAQWRTRYQARLDRLVQVTNTLSTATDTSGAGYRVAAHALWER